MSRVRLVRFGLIACVATGWAVILGLVVFIGPEFYTQATLLPRVEPRIGAEIRGLYVLSGGNEREVMIFDAVRPGSAAAQAGITTGDIIVSEPSIGSLLTKLNSAPGESVTVEVVTGGKGPPINQRPRRLVTILLP